ncbi:hypothetical protein AB834_03885 [PVC group bacterium (ex Bugula neritina AB1)]|nr:hypothetical protein AB834_03885 [PVC group bacterium (ex Bugula neritina AB1)]
MREEKKLERLKQQGLYRKMIKVEPFDIDRSLIKGRPCLNFGSNDYLGMSEHPDLLEAFRTALDQYGLGQRASRYICGHHLLYENVEQKIAQWLHAESCLLFSTGYMANLGTLGALIEPEDLVLIDRCAHASLIDGVKMSKASYKVFRHNDVGHLEDCLKRYAHKYSMTWVVCESVDSIFGDILPIQNIVDLKERYAFRLIVDEAHGVGVFGKQGEGVIVEKDCFQNVEVRMITMGKALGVCGGAVLGSKSIVDTVINKGRTSIYTTAMPLPLAAGLLLSVDLVQKAEVQRAHLYKLIGLCEEAHSPIVPFYFEGAERVKEVSDFFLERGFFIPAMRVPTVPKGKECLRLTLNATHKIQDIQRLLKELSDFKRE